MQSSGTDSTDVTGCHNKEAEEYII